MWVGGLVGLDVGFVEQSCVGREAVEHKTLLTGGHVRGGGVVNWVLEGISRRRRHLGCLGLRGERTDIGHGQVC
jgi:hypothetical protein